MAISLNNHETRIAALENRKIRWAKLWGTGTMLRTNTTLNFSESIYNFDVIILEYGCTNTQAPIIDLKETWLWRENIKFNDTATSDNNLNDYALVSHPDNHGIKTIYFRSNGTQMYVGNYNLSGSLLAVYGLKLYYNFSYNIISKIIRSIISSLVQKVAKSIPNFILKGGVRFGYFC